MSECGSVSPTLEGQYIAYPKAMTQLAGRLEASPEELAAWLFVGPELGGLAAKFNANELDASEEFHFDTHPRKGNFDYLPPLGASWFREDDIQNFTPTERYIPGTALKDRWSKLLGMQAEAFIHAKIGESRLLDIHPVFGQTQGSAPGDEWYPPMSSGLFELSKIEAIEKEDFDLAGGWTSETATAANEQAECDNAPHANLRETTDLCAIFRTLENLTPDEVTIAFVGDRNDGGLGANNMFEISARDVKKRIPLVALDLIDKRRGTLNHQGVILLGFAQNRMLPRNNKNSKRMSRLRSLLRDCLGLHGDPFEDRKLRGGWQPRFQIVDRRGAADERAKREAERRTKSFEQITARGGQFADAADGIGSSDDEEDDADA